MVNPTDINPILDTSLSQQVDASSPQQNTYLTLGAPILCFSLGQAQAQRQGRYCVERMVFGYQSRFAWLPALIPLFATELGFFSV